MVPKSLINKDEYLMQGLMSEIRIMQKLKSHNIVMLLDVLETGNNYYIIQEFCDGGDFAQYLIQTI
jgi:calcium-dependent protein kinase